MTFLITGYKGFIGSSIYSFLSKFNRYNIDGLTRNEELPDKIYDIVIHCAGITPSNANCNFDYIEDNINFTQKIINKYSNSKIIFISSRGIYGSPLDSVITEDTIPYKQSFYDMSKYLAEELIINSQNKYIILRLPTVLGIDSPPTFITKMISSIKNKNSITITNGDKKFNSIIHLDYINVVIQYIINNIDILYDEIYNIASSNFMYINDMPQLISSELHINLSNIIYDNNNNSSSLISIDKIQKNLKLPHTQDTIMKYVKEQINIK